MKIRHRIAITAPDRLTIMAVWPRPGIGANTVLFYAINTLFLPLSTRNRSSSCARGFLPERGSIAPTLPGRVLPSRAAASFTELLAQSFTLTSPAAATRKLQGVRVTENFFRALGVQPLLGRTFSPEEDRPGGANVAVLSHSFWQRRFGGDKNIIDQAVTLNGTPFTVIGIMPASVKFPFAQTHIWLPRVFEQEGLPPDIIERGTGIHDLAHEPA